MFKNIFYHVVTCTGSGYCIPHPLDSKRLLFFSFDVCHIIKNIRNQFLDRYLTRCGQRINFQFIKITFERQKRSILRWVRRLKRKSVYPSNIERQNVQLALDIFSSEMIGLFKSAMFTGSPQFNDCDETLLFIETFHKWFQLHDVSNCTQHIHQRLPDKRQFSCPEDERLTWLESEFLDYLHDWKETVKNQSKQFYLTTQTHDATVLTTRSTVHFIRYVMQSSCVFGAQVEMTRITKHFFTGTCLAWATTTYSRGTLIMTT